MREPSTLLCGKMWQIRNIKLQRLDHISQMCQFLQIRAGNMLQKYAVLKKARRLEAFDPLRVCLVCEGRSGDRVVGSQTPSNPPAPDDQTLIHQDRKKSHFLPFLY